MKRSVVSFSINLSLIVFMMLSAESVGKFLYENFSPASFHPFVWLYITVFFALMFGLILHPTYGPRKTWFYVIGMIAPVYLLYMGFIYYLVTHGFWMGR